LQNGWRTVGNVTTHMPLPMERHSRLKNVPCGSYEAEHGRLGPKISAPLTERWRTETIAITTSGFESPETLPTDPSWELRLGRSPSLGDCSLRNSAPEAARRFSNRVHAITARSKRHLALCLPMGRGGNIKSRLAAGVRKGDWHEQNVARAI